MTSSLIVLAFDTMDEAEKVHEALVQGKKEGQSDDPGLCGRRQGC